MDLTLYKDDKVVLAICSHESYEYMNVEGDEYEKLLHHKALKDLICGK